MVVALFVAGTIRAGNGERAAVTASRPLASSPGTTDPSPAVVARPPSSPPAPPATRPAPAPLETGATTGAARAEIRTGTAAPAAATGASPTPGAAGGGTGSSADRGSGPTSYASSAPEPPATDIPPDPDPSIPCRSPDDESACIADTVLAIDNARAQEGVEPMVLPADFEEITPSEQLFVMVDSERVDRGLSPIAGELGSLDQLSATAAQEEEDPSVPPDGVAGLTVGAWAGNWASTESDVEAMYQWMYDDGLGSGNVDCTATDQSGCWDHRDNILGFQNDVDRFGGSLSFGGGTASTGTAHQALQSVTMLVTWSPGSTSGYYYTWDQAVEDGAG